MLTLHRTLFALAIFALATFGAAPTGYCDVIVVPNSLVAAEGNSNIRFLAGTRFQQVHASSQFTAFGGPASITQIAFRPDAPTGFSFTNSVNPFLQVNLSTTSRVPDALSTTFADNVGVDDTVVYSGPITFFSSFIGPTGGPKEFDIVINLTRPFIYNPAAGNLLMDVRSAGELFGPAPVDLQISFGDAISRVEGRMTSPVGSANTEALVTRFSYSPIIAEPAPIPEPATMILLGTGLAGVAAQVRRRRTAKKRD